VVIIMKVLVTGYTGRFGPYVARELAQSGHEVILFGRKQPAESLRRFAWIQGDVNQFEDCVHAMQGGIDAVQHVAAVADPSDHPDVAKDLGRGVFDPGFDITMKTNLMGLYYMLHAALQQDVGIFVMTGSNCALGHGYRLSGTEFPIRSLPIDEKHPSDIEDSYSYSKLAGEQMLAMYANAYGMRTYSLRSAGIVNEQRRIRMAENAGPATAWDPWFWAWIGSEDLASAHRLLMENAGRIEPHGVYFCNNDDTYAVEPTVELVQKFRPDLLPLVTKLEGHDSILSNRKLKETVGWKPVTSWRVHQ
jgi:nucleoside-diphosphate-sugar epimerase